MTEDLSARQKAHYERIHDLYSSHYYDADSMAYRHLFIYQYLFAGLDLNGKEVADLASGAGMNSLALLQYFPRAQMTGFDISAKACAEYRKNLGRPAFEADLTKGFVGDQKFDVAMIIGGLHHCVVDLTSTICTVANFVKPGGLVLMMEPNADYFLEGVRQVWYRTDSYFEGSTEHALSYVALYEMAHRSFVEINVKYLGGLGYFLVLNSMIFRLPHWLKRSIARLLLPCEKLFNLLPGKRPFPYFVARWRRRYD